MTYRIQLTDAHTGRGGEKGREIKGLSSRGGAIHADTHRQKHAHKPRKRMKYRHINTRQKAYRKTGRSIHLVYKGWISPHCHRKQFR